MKKKIPPIAVLPIIIIVCVLAFYGTMFLVFSRIDINAPKITQKNIVTCYGDAFIINKSEYGFLTITTTFNIKYNDMVLCSSDVDLNQMYYKANVEIGWDEIINSFKYGDVRIYELNWGMVYTTDGGSSFKGVARDKYTDYCKMDKEFAEVYSMLYEKPFYDERFKEHLDMNRYKLLDSETAEEISISKTKSISDVEELAGKAQRCVLVDTEEGTENIQSVTFEYDLSDGRILVVHYLNQCEDNNLDLHLSHNYIREVYNPEEDQSPEATPTQPSSSSPSAAAA